MDGKLSAMAIGIFADEPAKRAQMVAAQWLQPVLVQVIQGRVCGVNNRVGSRVSVSGADIIDALASGAQAKLRTKDMSRFF